MAEDIVDELEAEGSDLSKRAARYIRIKRQTEAGLEQQLRSMCRKSLAAEWSPETVTTGHAQET